MKRDTPPSDRSTEEPSLDPSGVPTPRGFSWNNDHLTSTEDLPVVTARSEPTQRGLGVPPPPSSGDLAWAFRMPSIASLSPLSVDAFEKTPSVAPAQSGSPPGDPEATENERITVRAPPPAPSSPGRRRAMGASLAAAAVLLLSLFIRRATLEPQGVSAAQPLPIAAPAALPAGNTASPVVAATKPEAFAAQRAPEAAASDGVPGRIAAPEGDAPAQHAGTSRADKRRRKGAGAADVARTTRGRVSRPEPGPAPEAAQNHPAFTLPPR